MFVEGYYDEEFIPLIVFYDPEIDMWSYTVGHISGVADDKEELVYTVWNIVRNWQQNQNLP